MNDAHKRYVTAYLGAMMAVDGEIDDKEKVLWNFVTLICKLPTMNIVDAIAYMEGSQYEEECDFIHDLINGNNNPSEGSFIFHSNTHQRYKNERPVMGEQCECNRRIKIEKNNFGQEGYSVTILASYLHILGGHSLEKEHVIMATKPMKIASKSNGKIELKGWAFRNNTDFEDYGISIYHDENSISHCVLHMFDRNVDIDYYVK